MLGKIFHGGNPGEALEDTLLYLFRCYEAQGIQYRYGRDQNLVAKVLKQSRLSLGNLPTPSAFKKAAVLANEFVLRNPVSEPLPHAAHLECLPETGSRETLLRWTNARLALKLALNTMEGAQITRKDEQTFTLAAVTPSNHQSADLIVALYKAGRARNYVATRLLMLTFESLAYEFNPQVRYDSDKRPCHLADCPKFPKQ